MIYINKIKQILSKSVCARILYNCYREQNLLHKYYKNRKDNISSHFYKGIVFCVDGRVKHGGLADRFFGCLCVYALCKIEKCDFKLHYISPFRLEDYLQPNLYDWTIREGDLVYDSRISFPIVRLGDNRYYRNSPFYKKNKQIHFYSNFKSLDFINEKYGTNFSFDELYNELFRPSFIFQKDLLNIRALLPSRYISICFRFQNFFGDFFEAENPSASIIDQESMILKCHTNIELIIEKYKLPVLCTSDSQLFLNSLSAKRDVYTIPGKVVHMDYSTGQDFEIYEKSFIDFYMLGQGQRVIQFKGEHLWKSGFSRLAAYVQGTEYELKNLVV